MLVENWAPDDVMVNQTRLRKGSRTFARKGQKKETKAAGKFCPSSGTAPGHTVLSGKAVFGPETQHIAEPDQPPYSPDLAPCDFFLLPKIKSNTW